jgi:hypothetical protein
MLTRRSLIRIRTSASALSSPVDDVAPSNGDAEIVVDAIHQDPEDSVMHDLDDEEGDYPEADTASVGSQHKRKRTSVNYILHQNPTNELNGNSSPSGEPRVKRRQGPKVRGILIGVWRDSDQPDDEDKHVIFGFIDIHDRLRTRIYGMNKRGEEVIGNVPTGAGGCWVTFERVIFEPHLRGLTSQQVKEYVRLRDRVKLEEDEETRKQAEIDAVERAKVIAQNVAAGAQDIKIPSHPRRSVGRPSAHRETSGHRNSGFQAVNSGTNNTLKAAPSESKPNGVPLGYWIDSTEIRPEDKHAIYGILSDNDSFRAKVQKFTLDGRRVEGNYPVGAGAMWVHYEKVVFDPALAALSRPEVKEYCRIRQRELEHPETDKERRTNEARAIRDAKAIVAGQHLSNGAAANGQPTPEPELRHSARAELKQQQARQQAGQQAEAEAIAKRSRQEKRAAIEARQETDRKEVAAAEAIIKGKAEKELKHNIGYLNKVWMAQQTATQNGGSPAGSSFGGPSTPTSMDDDVKFYNGIRYERKKTGPFQGKLVGQPQMFQIDGEDYVEYRVLTKPSFF